MTGRTQMKSERWLEIGIFLMTAEKRQSQRMNTFLLNLKSHMEDMLSVILSVLQQKQEKFLALRIIIWMDTIEKGRFEDTNKIFEPPHSVDFHITEWR